MCVSVQGHALEQGHYSEGISGLHQEAAEGSATCQKAGDPTKEPGDRQPPPDSAGTGTELCIITSVC